MSTLLITIHVITTVMLVLLVLVQSGKGAEISASFGGSSQTLFGSSGGANFFTKLTAAMAAIFMTTSILLTLQSSENSESVFEGEAAAPVEQTSNAPATDADSAPANEEEAAASDDTQ